MSNTPELLVFHENKSYPMKLFKELFLENNSYEASGIIKSFGNSFCFKVVGFLLLDDKIIAIFPKGFAFSDYVSDDAAMLLKVLFRYRNSRNLEPEEIQMLRGDNVFKNGRLVSAIALLEDYQKNGYLTRNQVNRTHNVHGFPDWNRTVKTCTPLLSHRRPVYVDPVIRSSQTDTSNIITQIHKVVIGECLSIFSWLFGNSTDSTPSTMLLSQQEAISMLEIELQNTFVQREVEVIKLLIQYLSAKTGAADSYTVELLATPFFHNTWEAICGYVFENQYAILKGIVPHPQWKNAKVEGNIAQRPDILYNHNSKLYILDAKYYDYKKNLPGWHDVVKQLFYKFTIEKSINSQFTNHESPHYNSIVNAFVLPENSDDDMVHLGDIHVENVDELGDLHVFSINTRNAMHLYANKKKSDYRNLMEQNIYSISLS